MILRDQVVLCTIPLQDLVYSLLSELSPMIKESIREHLSMHSMHEQKSSEKVIHETYFSRKEAAKYLGITPPTLSVYVSSGWVKGYYLGSKQMKFKKADLDACLEEITTPKTKQL